MPIAESSFVIVAGIWAGALLGVSFIATPAKFRAPSITIPIALDVGRTTFRISLLIEILFGFLLTATALIAFGLAIETYVAIGLLALCVAQRATLLPLLSARTTQVMAGAPRRSPWLHVTWITLDAVRFLLLLGLCVVTLG